MTAHEIIEETKQQILKKKDVNGADVAIWLVRHATYLFILVPIFLAVFAYIWTYHLGPKVDIRAARLDTLIIRPVQIQVDTLKNQVKGIKRAGKETYYLVRQMEMVQRRTSPRRIVEEAKEEIELEKELNAED